MFFLGIFSKIRDIAKSSQKETIDIHGKQYPMNACAGVAIIPHRYPFWLGFDLADRLCEHAKKRLQTDAKQWRKLGYGNKENAHDTSLIDWQLVESGGSIDNIESFRKRYYETKDGASLTMRPYYIQPKSEKTHFSSYEHAFYRAVQVIEETIEKSEKCPQYPGRSKWKGLRDVYHQGPEAVNQWVLLNQFIALKDRDNKQIDIIDKFFFKFAQDKDNPEDNGFRLKTSDIVDEGKDHAFYYDALEILDYFVLLSGVDDR